MSRASSVLSDPGIKVLVMPFHPWRAIRDMGERVEVIWEKEPGRVGSWCERSGEMRLDPGQNQAERRCTAAHESVHVRRGDSTCDASVHQEAAYDLIDINDLAEALAFWGEENHAAVAEELWVDLETLKVRRRHLHPSERGVIRRRLEMKEDTA